MKRINLLAVGLMLLAVGRLLASDLERGITFVDGQRLTASELHQLIDDTTIGPAFYTGKSAETTLATGDQFLIYSPTLVGFRKATAATVLYNNTLFITGQTEKGAPAGGDYLLLYDAAGTVLKKVSVGNLVLNNTNLFLGASNITAATSTALLLLNQGGTNVSITLGNLLASFDYSKAFTNLLTHTTPTNEDRLLIWDSLHATNKTTTLAGLYTNLPAATVSNTDVFMSLRAATGVVQQVTLAQVATYLSNNVVRPATTNYVTYQTNLPFPGTMVSIPHNLGAIPTVYRGALVIFANDTATAYSTTDGELNMQEAGDDGNDFPFALVTRVDANNFYVLRSNNGTFKLRKKTTGEATAVTSTNNFRIKFYYRP